MAATQGRHATADKFSADIAHPRHSTSHKERHVVSLRYEARAEREARDTTTGLAAEPLVGPTSTAFRGAWLSPLVITVRS